MAFEDLKSNQSRKSPHCKMIANRVIITRKILLGIILFITIIPLLYLIPCDTSYIGFYFQTNYSYEPMLVPAYISGTQTYENLTLSPNYTENDFSSWKISSIDLYFSSFTPNADIENMIQYVIYGKSNIFLQKTNTLKIPVISEDSITGNFDSFYMFKYLEVPVDYVLSYLRITIEPKPGYENQAYFTCAYYAFFQEENRAEIQFGVISDLHIIGFTFDKDAYDQWYAWKFEISSSNFHLYPKVYPFQIQYEIRRHNLVTEFFGVESI